jgi:hypothetical protein
MIVEANYKPRKFSDAELDAIERSGSGDFEEFAAVLCRTIRRMSDDEKRELRENWIGHVDEKEQIKKNDRRFLKSVGVNPDGDD